jgi:hypothetical protein
MVCGINGMKLPRPSNSKFLSNKAPKLKKDPCRPTEKNKKKRYFLEIPVRGLRVVIRSPYHRIKPTVESNTETLKIWQDATKV